MAPRLEDLLADVAAIEDPVERFRAVTELGERHAEESGSIATRIRTERTRVVRELRARDPQPSWREIGELLGISGERARTLHDDTKETVQ